MADAIQDDSLLWMSSARVRMVNREIQCLPKGTEGPVRSALIALIIVNAYAMEAQVYASAVAQIAAGVYRENRQVQPYYNAVKEIQTISREARRLQRLMLKVMDLVGEIGA